MPKQFVICLAIKTERMPAYGHYPYHFDCWDRRESTEDKVHWITGKVLLSSQLSTEQTPVPHGFVRLIPLADMAINATCCYCGKILVMQKTQEEEKAS
jgi:hypothetical protein